MNDLKKEEYDKIIHWCEARLKETKRVVLVERNPFQFEIPWTSKFIFIEINKPKELANKRSLVYDSSNKKLYEYYMDEWKEVKPKR